MEKRKIVLSSWFLIYCFRNVTFQGLDKLCKELVYEVFKIGCFQIGPGKKVVESAQEMKEKKIYTYFRAVKLNLRNKANVFNIIYHFSTNLPNFTLLLFLFFFLLLTNCWKLCD